MKLELQVKKKQFTTSDGEIKSYYELTTELSGETFRLRADDKDKKLLNHMLNQQDIPLEHEDNKEELMRRLLSGEKLSEAEKAKLQSLLDGEEV